MRQSPVNTLERVMPNSLDAERAVLGAVLCDPEEAGRQIFDSLAPDHFYHGTNQTIFRAMLALRDAKKPVEIVLLSQYLRDAGQLEEVGGAAYLGDLFSAVPSAAHAEHYIDTVREKSVQRELIESLHNALAGAYEPGDDLPAFLDRVERDVLKATGALDTRAATATLREGAALFMERLAARLDTDAHGVTGLATGFGKFDKYTTGLHPLYYLVAARPSVGKTVLLMNWAEELCLNQNRPAAIFSIEMSLEELSERVYPSVARVNSMAIRSGQITQEDHAKIINVHNQIAAAPLYIDDDSNLDILELRRRARRLVHKHHIEAIFVDYAQLITSGSKIAQQNDVWRLQEVSAGLKSLQRELKIPVIVAAQLNREMDKRGDDSRPRLSDLKGCGGFEQDADAVFALHRKIDAEEKADRAKTELLILKQRHGPLGKIQLTYLEDYYRFESAAL